MGRVCTCNCAAAVRAGELRKRMLHLASATMKGFTCSVAVSLSLGTSSQKLTPKGLC